VSTCTVSGDPHYRTFDQAQFTYQGICKLNLASPCKQEDDPPFFQIFSKNIYRFNITTVSYPSYVIIVYKGRTVKFTTSKIATSVGGADAFVDNGATKVGIPYTAPQFKIYVNGYYLRYEAIGAGFTVDFYALRAIVIKLPAKYYKKMCGLCGNDDVISTNDLVLKNGTDVSGSDLGENLFGDNWVVPDPEVTDPKICPAPPPSPPCKNAQYEALCANMKNPSGPFGDCVRGLPPNMADIFYGDCVLDACNSKGETICTASVPMFLAECNAAGFAYGCDVWKTAFQCGTVSLCPAGMVYKCAVTACQASCADPNAALACNLPPTDSCVCPTGQFLHNGVCVAKCPTGCLDPNGVLLPIGMSWDGLNCTTKTCVKCANCPYGGKVQSSNDCTSKQTCVNGLCSPAATCVNEPEDPFVVQAAPSRADPYDGTGDVTYLTDIVRVMFKGYKFSDPDKKTRMAAVDKAFRIMNKCDIKGRKTGYVDAAQLQQIIAQRTSNLNYSIDECAALLAPADANADGRLSQTEFQAAMLM
jgi:hypothetical protein